MKIENLDINWKKIGVTILSVGLISGASFGVYKYVVEPGSRVEAQRSANANEKFIESTTKQVTSGLILADVKSKIDKSLVDKSKLDESELDRLTYYLYKYNQANYKFVGADSNDFDLGFQTFVDLKKLYEQSDLKAPFDYDDKINDITFNRDVKKPSDYDQKIDEVKQVSKEKVNDLVNKGDGDVNLESEGIIE